MAQGLVGTTSIFPRRPREWYSSASSRRTIFFFWTGLEGGFLGGVKSVAIALPLP